MGIVSSEFIYRGLLDEPQFSWLERVPYLYQVTTQAFEQVGLPLTELRTIGTAAEPAEFAVVGKAEEAAVTLKTMVHGIQLSWNSYGKTAPSAGTGLVHSAFEYLSRECTGLNYKIQNVTWAGHLECPNISSREYLKRSVPPLPKELDGAEGTGISFCLPPLDERLSFNVKLEPSLSLADGIYARLDFSWSGTLSPEQLGSRTSSEIERALNALALEPGRVFTS